MCNNVICSVISRFLPPSHVLHPSRIILVKVLKVIPAQWFFFEGVFLFSSFLKSCWPVPKLKSTSLSFVPHTSLKLTFISSGAKNTAQAANPRENWVLYELVRLECTFLRASLWRLTAFIKELLAMTNEPIVIEKQRCVLPSVLTQHFQERSTSPL